MYVCMYVYTWLWGPKALVGKRSAYIFDRCVNKSLQGSALSLSLSLSLSLCVCVCVSLLASQRSLPDGCCKSSNCCVLKPSNRFGNINGFIAGHTTIVDRGMTKTISGSYQVGQHATKRFPYFASSMD